MKLSLIVALTREGVMGKDNKLPWNLPEDLRRFKELTVGHHIIMGRKTWESLGKVLPGRTHVVLTRNAELELPSAVLRASTLAEALILCRADEQPFVIGGAEIFKLALPLASHLYLTWIDSNIDGDTYFPDLSLKDFTPTQSKLNHGASFSFEYVDYIRQQKANELAL